MLLQNRNLQQSLRNAHLWLGLIGGLFIVMMGLTGLIIVFRPLFESSVSPKVAPLSGRANLTAMEQTVAAEYPGARISRVIFPEAENEPLLVEAEAAGQERFQFFVDPSSGKTLGLKKNQAWLDWIVDLHQNLLLGKTGRALTGVIGTALLLLSLSGLCSWLAGQRDWKRTLALPQRGAWRRVSYQGHKWAGLWTNALMLVVSFTGIVLVYPDTFQQVAGTVMGEAPPPAKKKDVLKSKAIKEYLPLQEYVGAAATAIPNGVARELRMPSRGRRTVSISMWAPGDIRPKGGNTVYLDPAGATVVSIELAAASPLSRKLVDLANAIHKTELGGLPLKALWSLLGLVPAIMFLTGLQIWWNQRQTALRAALRAQEAVASAEMVHK
jgi:uncharacterized iron-regulated membrane protein